MNGHTKWDIAESEPMKEAKGKSILRTEKGDVGAAAFSNSPSFG